MNVPENSKLINTYHINEIAMKLHNNNVTVTTQLVPAKPYLTWQEWVINLWVSLTKSQTITIENSSDKLPWLLTDFIRSQQWVQTSRQNHLQLQVNCYTTSASGVSVVFLEWTERLSHDVGKQSRDAANKKSQ